MKLWLLLLITGNVGATWGPLPYDLAECRERAAEILDGIDAKLEVTLDGRVIGRKDLRMYCVLASHRPKMID